MTYEIFFTAQAKKFLKKLDTNQQERIMRGIQRCQVRPYAHVKKLVASSYFRLRIGEYRAIVDVNDGKLIIMVLEIGHRKNVYKKKQ